MFSVFLQVMKVVIAHGSVEICEATPCDLVDESKESLYGLDTSPVFPFKLSNIDPFEHGPENPQLLCHKVNIRGISRTV